MRVISIIKPFCSIWRFPRRRWLRRHFGAPYEEQSALHQAINEIRNK